MEFLNPAALYASFLLPLLLIPYLIKGRPRRQVFSSLMLLKEFASRSSGRTWGRLYLPPIFFLQLLLLLLLVLALGEPVFSVRPIKVAIVLDNSASMQALEGRKSRFELAQDAASGILRDLGARARVDLYLLVPRLERIGEEAMAPGKLMALIRTLSPYDMGDSVTNYGDRFSRLVEEKGYERLFFLTDHPVQGQGGVIKAVSLGAPKDNLAISSFELFRPSLGKISALLEARVEVTSFSSREGKVKVALKGAGKILASKALTVAPGKVATASFEGLPLHPYYEAEIDAKDALALDNHRFAVPSLSADLKILAVSPRPQSLATLTSIPGVTLRVISPEGYAKSEDPQHSLEIFHFSTPATLPRHHALFILPPKDNPLVAEEKSLSRPVISSWRDPHPLTRYVNFALFRPNYARTLRPLSVGETIIQSPEGALAIAFESQGYRYLVLGFDPFPYLGRQNLPVSIFTFNLLGWFYEGRGGSSFATGEPLELKDATLVTPQQEKFQSRKGSPLFSRTFDQGLYQIIRGGEKEWIAINLASPKESDLNNPVPVDLTEETSRPGSRSSVFSLWAYLLLLSILLLLLEWYFNPPVTQS
jgi:hypothetical protein